MDFGIVHAKIDEIGYITHAENLGYSHCWVTDSQMIRSNCWAVLALAAQQTRRIVGGRLERNSRWNAGFHPEFELALNGWPVQYQRIARIASSDKHNARLPGR